MIAVDDIERLVTAARLAGVTELEVAAAGQSLRLRIARSEASRHLDAERPAAVVNAAGRVVSPGVGLFRHAHPVTGQPSVHPGDNVQATTIVAFLQVGPALRAVTAGGDGVLSAPLLPDGKPVGYGDLLFLLT